MRLPIIIASGLVAASLAYRYYARNEVPTVKTIFSWSFVLIILSVLEATAFANLANIFIYIIIAVIVLNDGYDMLKGF